jgi:predicted 3-demethylubiquinone-9 3-methyltransferase (glyoxalase superfamily)
MESLATCLMFVGDQHGKAEEAMSFYVSLFQDSRVVDVERYGAGEEEPEGTLKRARFSLAGRDFLAMDSAREHAFTFTPAISIFVDCQSEAKVDELFAKLSDGGTVLMPLGEYPFSPRFAWVADRYGVSWQLSRVGEPLAARLTQDRR